MNILIIGAGYLGLAVSAFLQKKGHTVTATTRSSEKIPLLQSKANKVFLIQAGNLIQAFENQDVVIFTAAAQDPDSYSETYLENAKIIQKAFELYPRLKQVIYTGSTSVYGEHQGAIVTEKSNTLPLTLQAKILSETENTLQQIPQSCIFRLGELIGEGRTVEERLQKAAGTSFPGTGDSMTNFSPLQDVIRAIHFAIEKPLAGIYNLCSSLHVPRKELYEQIVRAKNIKPIRWDPKMESSHGGNRIVNSEKIQNAGFVFESAPWEGILNPLPSLL